MFYPASSRRLRHGSATHRVCSVALAAALLGAPVNGFGQDVPASQPHAQDPGGTNPPAPAATSPPPPSTPATLAPDPAAGKTVVPRLTFNPGDYATDFSPGESPTSPYVEMEEIAGDHMPMLQGTVFDGALNTITRVFDNLYAETGLRLRFAFTTVFQQASAGPGDRNGWAGDLDIMSDWTLLGRGTPNTGRLIITGEYRFKMFTDITPNALGPEIGTLQRTTGGFNDRGWVLRDFHWVQRLFDDKLRVLIGRSDVSDYVGGHRLQSINNSFSNRNFSADSTTAWPAGHVLSAGVSIRPVDWFYATIGGANANGTSGVNDMQFLDEGEFFTFGEFGFTPTIENLGWGRYALLLWHMDQREMLALPSDQGFTVIGEQDLGEKLQVFARYGWGDKGTLTGIKWSAQVGMGYRGLLGSPFNLTGAAFGISDPTADGLSEEKVVEVFHRFQLTNLSQFSVGIQGIFDPSNAPEDDALAVLTVRYRVAF